MNNDSGSPIGVGDDGVVMDWVEEESKHLIPVYIKRGLTLVKGEDVYVYDDKGKKYLDLTTNYGANSLGYSNQAWQSALKQQVDTLVSNYSSYSSDVRVKFLEKLSELFPGYKALLINSGAEAVEAALKFSFVLTGRKKVLSAKGGYHGRTIAALSATHIPTYRKDYPELMPEFDSFKLNDIDDFKSKLDGSVAAVMLEPIQGAGGANPCDKEFFIEVAELCKANGTLFIDDEVQTGFRVGAPTVADIWNVKPDMFTFAKAIGGGFPIGVTLLKDEHCDDIPINAHGTTFGGNPLACVAGLKTLEEFDRLNVYENSQKIGEYLKDQLEALNSPIVREVVGMGLMIGIKCKKRIGENVHKLQQEGVLVIGGGTVIRILAPLVMTKDHADEFIAAFKRVFV